MITAENYTARAERDLRALMASPRSDSSDKRLMEGIAEAIKEAQHFALPDHGKIFDDDLRGIVGQEVRLPYPTITVEYFVPPGESLAPGTVYVPKRVIFATEYDRSFLLEMCTRSGSEKLQKAVSVLQGMQGGKAIMLCAFFSYKDRFIPCPAGFLLASSWDHVDPTYNYRTFDSKGKEYTGPGMVGRPALLFPSLVKGLPKEVFLSLVDDIGTEARVLLEFLEALSCRNVQTEPIKRIDPAVNIRRINAGKLPLYETKMLTLACSPGAAGLQPSIQAGERASPRQHLRRGHIRRLETGNIWVNSCVVGDPGRGFIKKDYRLTA